ncbi:MAG: outer membrane protein [Syntrophobacteraceae bacterium]
MKLARVSSVLLLSCILLSGQIVLAADGAPSGNWTGLYAGLHIGNGWGNSDTNFYPLPDAATFGISQAKVNLSPNGAVGGLQVGYSYQMGCWVAGIEADFSGSGMSSSKTVSPILDSTGDPIPDGGALTTHHDINWFGTLRPRLGYTIIPTVLVYGTAGFAYGNVSSSANTDLGPLLPVFYAASSNTTATGWTAGGGIEWAFSKCWTLKAEYLYIDLGSQSTIANPNLALLPATQVRYTWQTTAGILNFGVNYRF